MSLSSENNCDSPHQHKMSSLKPKPTPLDMDKIKKQINKTHPHIAINIKPTQIVPTDYKKKLEIDKNKDKKKSVKSFINTKIVHLLYIITISMLGYFTLKLLIPYFVEKNLFYTILITPLIGIFEILILITFGVLFVKFCLEAPGDDRPFSWYYSYLFNEEIHHDFKINS